MGLSTRRNLKREVKEHLKGKFAIFIIFLFILSFFAGYFIGSTKATLDLCVDYAYRYLKARGVIDLTNQDLEYFKFLAKTHPTDLNRFIDNVNRSF